MANTKPENGKQAANPKQVLILGALLAVMVTVGVVQFGGMFGGGAPPAPNPSGQPNNNTQSPTPPTEQANANRLTLPPLSPRDPFRPVIAVAQPEQEASRVVRSEPTSRPKREITGTPPLTPVTLPPGSFGLQPTENAPAPEQPNYTITGVVQGPNSVAILVDKEGRRRFVKQGDPLEEGWRVVSIQRGAIVLQKGKQRIRARVGESTAPNGGNTP